LGTLWLWNQRSSKAFTQPFVHGERVIDHASCRLRSLGLMLGLSAKVISAF
jgi:hypothetical protein